MAEIKSEEKDSQYEALLKSNFKQQKLSAWRPVPTIASTTITFLIFGVIFLAIGIVVLLYSNQIVEYTYDYTNECKTNAKCNVTLTINQTMTQPIMVYYQLNNFYQNHRRYVKSKSNKQLAGEALSVDDIKSDCDPVYLNLHIGPNLMSFTNKTLLDPNAPANPCGLIAKSFFNDRYQLSTLNKQIKINEAGIAWESDKNLKYKINNTELHWLNPEDEHFMVWMRPAGLPNFRKLWGKIEENLEPDTYTITFENNYKIDYGGQKFFVISTVNAFGGKNSFLGISYIVVGGICILMAILFFFGYKSHSKTS